MIVLSGKCLFVVPFILAFLVFSVLNNRAVTYNFNCTCKAPICTYANSSFTRHEPYIYSLSVGGYIARRPKKVNVRAKKFMKKGRSAWQIANIDITFGFCEFINGIMKVPLLDVFSPGLIEEARTNFPICPFEGVFNVQNHTVVSRKFLTNYALGALIRTDVLLTNERSMEFFNCSFHAKVNRG